MPWLRGTRRGNSGLCPFGVWISPRMETPQPLWVIYFSVMTTLTERKIFHLFELISCISGCIHHLLFFAWSPTEKNLRKMFNSHIRYLYALVRYPMRLLQAEQFQLSQPPLKWQMFQSYSAVQPHCWAVSTMSIPLPYWGVQHWSEHCRCVLPVLRRGAASPPSTCCQCGTTVNILVVF